MAGGGTSESDAPSRLKSMTRRCGSCRTNAFALRPGWRKFNRAGFPPAISSNTSSRETGRRAERDGSSGDSCTVTFRPSAVKAGSSLPSRSSTARIFWPSPPQRTFFSPGRRNEDLTTGGGGTTFAGGGVFGRGGSGGSTRLGPAAPDHCRFRLRPLRFRN